MVNIIWGFMIVVGIVYGVLTGNVEAVSNGVVSYSKEAVELCITLLGVIATWTGIMEIAVKSGLVTGIKQRLMPVLSWLFPSIPRNDKAFDYISMNIIANMLGLGWAATPSGLLAMKELARLNHNRSVASNSMCTFLIINISSLQLIPINIIAYRSQYKSINPNLITAPALIATAISTITAVIYSKAMCRISKELGESV